MCYPPPKSPSCEGDFATQYINKKAQQQKLPCNLILNITSEKVNRKMKFKAFEGEKTGVY